MTTKRFMRRLAVVIAGAAALGVFATTATSGVENHPQPFHMDGKFHTLLVPPTEDCPLPYLLVNGLGTATGSLVGKATATAAECSLPVWEQNLFIVRGKGTFTTQTGDMLFLEYDETSNAPDFTQPNPVLYDSGTFTVAGGTGRFEGATGSGTISAVVTISLSQTGEFSADVVADYDGTILLDRKPEKPAKPGK